MKFKNLHIKYQIATQNQNLLEFNKMMVISKEICQNQQEMLKQYIKEMHTIQLHLQCSPFYIPQPLFQLKLKILTLKNLLQIKNIWEVNKQMVQFTYNQAKYKTGHYIEILQNYQNKWKENQVQLSHFIKNLHNLKITKIIKTKIITIINKIIINIINITNLNQTIIHINNLSKICKVLLLTYQAGNLNMSQIKNQKNKLQKQEKNQKLTVKNQNNNQMIFIMLNHHQIHKKFNYNKLNQPLTKNPQLFKMKLMNSKILKILMIKIHQMHKILMNISKNKILQANRLYHQFQKIKLSKKHFYQQKIYIVMTKQIQINLLILQGFLDRIKIQRKQPSVEYLFEITRQCFFNIPFENLDIVQRKRITLNTDICYEKIVNNKRGGLCYEINGILYTTLKEIGFNVIPIQAQVKNPQTGIFGPKFDHLLCLVDFNDIKEQYLVDVGFGDFYRKPIPFKMDQVLDDITGQFKLQKMENEEGYYTINMLKPNTTEYKLVYKFDLQERKLEDFEETCQIQFTNQEWLFNKITLILVASENGWIILTSKQLSIIENQERSNITIENQEQFDKYLQQYFGIQNNQINIKI